MSDKDPLSDALLSAAPTAEGAESTSVHLFRLLSQKHGDHPGCFGAESALPQPPHLPPAVEMQAVQTHPAPSLSASVQSSCPVQQGGRVEGTQEGSCLPSRGLKNQSNISQGEHLCSLMFGHSSPDILHICHFWKLNASVPYSPGHSYMLTPQTHTHPSGRCNDISATYQAAYSCDFDCSASTLLPLIGSQHTVHPPPATCSPAHHCLQR